MLKRIALIHATPVAMSPVRDAFEAGWPEAETVNLLDDALSLDLARTGQLDEAMMQRFQTLSDYALGIGVDGILFTCSAFGEAIAAVAESAPVPVLKPNEAMFEEALARGQSMGLITTFQPSVPSMQQEFDEMASGQEQALGLKAICVSGAMEALASGDAATHDRLIAEAAPQVADCDIVMLAQFSMARARPALGQAYQGTVLTSPDSAVAKLKRLLAD